MTHEWELASIAVATAAATLGGGAVALRFGSATPLLMGFGAGAVTGVAVFDLLPEALRIAGSRGAWIGTIGASLASFATWRLVDSMLLARRTGARGHARGALLTGHSLLDGLAIGLAFHVSAAAGLVVALGVLAHDMIDGANTVTLSLSGGAGRPAARQWLVADALAPTAGILVSTAVSAPRPATAVVLGAFAGVFLAIGLTELLPQALASRRAPPALAGAAGLALVWAAVRLAG